MHHQLRWTLLCLPLAAWTACGDDDSTSDADVADAPTEDVAPDAADADAPEDDGAPPDADAADDAASCLVEELPAQPFVQALMLLHDRSASMVDPALPWWDDTRTGVVTFIDEPASDGLLVGLQFFPVPPTGPIPTTCSTDADCGLYGPCVPMTPRQCAGAFSPNTSCAYTDYLTPTVALAALPAARSALTNAYDAAEATGEATPTQPAFQGTLEYFLGALAVAPPDLASVVFVTDGQPTGCTDNTIEGTAALVAAAFAGTTSVTTHVVQLGNPTVDFSPIAAAGGTDASHFVAPDVDVAAWVTEFLRDIRAESECHYRTPTPTAGTLDVDALNLELRDPGSGTPPVTVPKVARDSDCSPTAGGWRFVAEPGPGPVVLCPATCNTVAADAPDVVFVLGCPTVTAP